MIKEPNTPTIQEKYFYKEAEKKNQTKILKLKSMEKIYKNKHISPLQGKSH